MPSLAVGDSEAVKGQNWLDPAVYQPRSGVFAGGLVLLSDAGRDLAAVADRDAVGFRPRPDTITGLPVRRSPPAPAARPPPGLARR
jgi:hypothetical protein